MPLEKQPFVNYTLEEQKEMGKYGRPFTLRCNKKEWEDLKALMAMFDVKGPGTAMKIAAFSYLRVLQSHLHPRYLAYLFKKDRARLSDYETTERYIDKKL